MEWLIGTHTIGTVSRRTKADGHLRFTFSNAHIDAESARKLGFPAPFDIGNQRVAWLASLLTGWMGDHGELKALRCKFQRLIFVGDIPTCGGTIVKKRVDERDHLVDLELWVKNQRYEEVSVGTATVALPLR
jgi:acyl dehydratase